MALTNKHKTKAGRQKVPQTMPPNFQETKQKFSPINESEIIRDRVQTTGTNIDSSRRVWLAPKILTFPCASTVFDHDRDLSETSISHQTQPSDHANLSKVNSQDTKKSFHSLFQHTDRPRLSHGWAKYAVANEMVLLSPEHDKTVSLNLSAKVIWELCDGRRTVAEISDELGRYFTDLHDDPSMELSTALETFQELNLIEISEEAVIKRPSVKFIVGIEDKTYFHWQLPILLESLKDRLPVGWEIIVIVCNNHVPLSEPLSQILMAYQVKYFTTTNHPFNENMDFASGGDFYVPLNRIQALSAVADYVQPDDLVCLLETDIFLYMDLNLDVIPTGNALSKNWIVEEDLFFTLRGDPKGVNLQKLLASLGCTTPFQPGGVIIFLTGETIQNRKFIQDCFRFTQILYLLGKMIEVPKVWVAEMPSFAMSLALNSISYDLLDCSEFTTQNVNDLTINPGSFYHYYHDMMDGGDGAFYKSKWYKQLFTKENFLHTDISEFSGKACSNHEKYFFEMAEKAQKRLYVSNP